MLDFQCKSSTTINGFEIKAYDVDPKFDDALKNLLKNKIQKIKLYDIEKYSDYLPADTTPEYREAFKKKLLSIAVPDNHKINWFNVKRTITTEFMSQLLLENNFNCIFHEEVDKRINDALEKVEMLDFKNKDLYNLSLGQKQRIMIAEILAKNPKYLIFDEPTTMIDSIGKEKIYKIIKNLKQQGYTIICITNLADEILLADRTLVLEQGKIALEIKREELVEKAEELRKYEIKLPTILEILVELQKNGIQVNAKDYTIPELVNYLVTAKAGGSK